MRLLHVTHPSGYGHDTGSLHPERPARLRAAAAGIAAAGVEVVDVEAEPIEAADLTIVHDGRYVEAVRRLCSAGGGELDPDTPVSDGSWDAALAAAGAGPTAVSLMLGGFDGPAFIAVRPPGHHATGNRGMGFCLFNNIAVTAARLRDDGSRVAIVDWDVHHGNGTQAIFFDDPDVFYASIHQFPFYPHEGSVGEVGRGAGAGTTLNIPVPAYTAGDVYLTAFRDIVIPALGAFAPDWLLVSSGFDAHAADPLAELRLVESDYGALAGSLSAIVSPDRTVAFLEGGYHLPALRDSVSAVARGLVGVPVEGEASPFTSPPESHRAIEEARRALNGRVVGVG